MAIRCALKALRIWIFRINLRIDPFSPTSRRPRDLRHPVHPEAKNYHVQNCREQVLMKKVKILFEVRSHIVKQRDAQQVERVDDQKSGGYEPYHLFYWSPERHQERYEHDHHVETVTTF